MNRYNMTHGFEQAWNDFVTFAPKILLAMVVLVVGYVVARLFQRLLAVFLQRVGFDKLVERGSLKRVLSRTSYEASALLAKLFFYAVMLLVFQFAFGIFGPNPVSALLTDVVAFLPKLFAALLIVVVTSAIAAALKDILQGVLAALSYGHLLADVAAAFLVATGIFAALSQMNIAPAIVNGLYYALLAIIAGCTIVAVGGGGIAPMRARWEKFLDHVEQEAAQQRETTPATVPNVATPRTEIWPKATAGDGPKKN